MFLLIYFIYEILKGSRVSFNRYLTPLSAILINIEEFFLAEFFLEEKLFFLLFISDLWGEPLLVNIIGIKAFTILLTLFCFLFFRFKFINKYLDIFILSILISYGLNAYYVSISTGNYVPGLISSFMVVLPVWLLAVKNSLKKFLSISSLSIMIIFAFIFNSLYFFDISSLLSS